MNALRENAKHSKHSKDIAFVICLYIDNRYQLHQLFEGKHPTDVKTMDRTM